MLFRCGAYRDLIQSTLVRYELPTDLWAIVFVESGCTPQATSPVGAAGLWQFMPATGRAYHLRIKEDVIDERRSPPKSTEAAVRYLRDIREKLLVYNAGGVWDLMFGAYNLGPFGMIARLERVGGNGIGFWDLVDAKMLPDETAMYAPAIQAVALILNNLQRYKFSTVQMRTPQLTSDLEVPPGTRLSLVARAASMNTRDLRAMNLDISGETTPDIPNLAIQVPKDVVWQARDTLKELIANRDQMDQCVPPTFDWGRQRFTKEMAAACQRKLGAKGL
jgi:membrane-bound lytic murein transglycosylase D